MPLFSYTATTQSGQIEKGQREAQDKQTLLTELASQNLIVISITQQTSFLKRTRIPFLSRIKIKEKEDFFTNLSVLLSSGIGLAEGLDVLAADCQNSTLKNIMLSLKKDVENGQTLSHGLARYPHSFSPVLVNVLQAGEAAGKLEETLANQSLQLRKENELYSKIKGSLTYPIILMFGTAGVIFLMLGFVVPRLESVFADMSIDLPWFTRFLIALSVFISSHKILSFIIFIIIIGFLIFIITSPFLRRQLQRLLIRLPWTSALLRNTQLARLSIVLGGLLQAGVPIVEALDITATAISQPEYQTRLVLVKQMVAKGVSLANAFKKEPHYFPSLLTSMVGVGEKSGKLEDSLYKLSDYYQEQVDSTVRQLTTLIEPILLLLIGALIGGIALSLILPIYQLIGKI